MTVWRVTSARIDETVEAPDQHAAWNTLRHRPLQDFGLIVVATPDGNDDESIPVHTQALLCLWGRDDDARRCIAVAQRQGLPATWEKAMAYAMKHGRMSTVS